MKITLKFHPTSEEYVVASTTISISFLYFECVLWSIPWYHTQPSEVISYCQLFVSFIEFFRIMSVEPFASHFI